METILDKYIFLVRLNQFPKFGSKKLSKLKSHFGSWERAFEAGQGELIEAGIEKGLSQEFIDFRAKTDWELLSNRLYRQKIRISVLGEDDYPNLLGQIPDPPLLIYYKGDICLDGYPPLAVVGSRKYTDYGKNAVDSLAGDLAKNGLCLISGLAIGIDSLAHEKALENQAKTIAVLGSGIDVIYPERNFSLAQRIISSGGAIVSEFPPSTPGFRSNFPMRNRIISGLSLGVLVIEAKRSSGSLITAFCALDQNREVFAVPGDIDRLNSVGTNELIKKGAIPATEAEDVLEALNLEKKDPETKQTPQFSQEEKSVLSVMAEKPTCTQEIFELTKLDTKVINSTLSILEIKKIIKNIGNNHYKKI